MNTICVVANGGLEVRLSKEQFDEPMHSGTRYVIQEFENGQETLCNKYYIPIDDVLNIFDQHAEKIL